jgi:hypothetical protein
MGAREIGLPAVSPGVPWFDRYDGTVSRLGLYAALLPLVMLAIVAGIMSSRHTAAASTGGTQTLEKAVRTAPEFRSANQAWARFNNHAHLRLLRMLGATSRSCDHHGARIVCSGSRCKHKATGAVSCTLWVTSQYTVVRINPRRQNLPEGTAALGAPSPGKSARLSGAPAPRLF